MAAGAQLKHDEHAAVQLLARPAGIRQVRKARRAATRLRTGNSGGDTWSRHWSYHVRVRDPVLEISNRHQENSDPVCVCNIHFTGPVGP